jgi:hypothetical protein
VIISTEKVSQLSCTAFLGNPIFEGLPYAASTSVDVHSPLKK